ncbi:MAG TPA: aldose 1-epimerase family protein [Solirubrobacteraceae bacterium]|jgi:Domain of unknown function (DUF4432)|nr:aldose 1-epimerase family protein [Solirubrobacteraceae bacterium]
MRAISSLVTDGRAAGCRAIDLRVPEGIDLRLLPDRGLDAGDAWFSGAQLSWTSPVGETAPVAYDWMRSFGGGLMVTCGLRNVGVPSEGQPQHGEFTFQRAEVTAVERSGDALEVRGRIEEVAALGYWVEVDRTWRTWAGDGRVELEDVVVNRGRETSPALQLYHVNLGAPLWAEGSELVLDANATRPRDDDAAPHSWNACPGVVPGAAERVYEHDVRPGADGWCIATVRGRGLELEVRWDAATMPRLWQWVHPAPGLEVLGLEPANCSVLGAAQDRAEGRLPELAPGEERRTRLEIRARRR